MEFPYVKDSTCHPTEVISCQIKVPVPDIEFCSWNCQIRVSQKSPKVYSLLLPLLLIAQQNLMV